MSELKIELQHSKDFKLYKEAWQHFVDCKSIDDLKDDELKLLNSYILFHLKNSLSLNIQMVFNTLDYRRHVRDKYFLKW
jgi:hypothetical protein